ncbi:hypothetical protein Tco_0761469 [Tanacetum coccineum]
MSPITAQKIKLDLELVPKEKRLEIRKCNGRLNPGKIQREPTFQIVLDALALTPCYSTFLITADVPKMHQPWRNFAALINRSLSGKTFGLDKLCLSRAQILWGMYHQKNVGYVELFWEDFIYQIDNKAYKEQEKMYYPRFTKVIIHYFLTQDKTLSWRNKIRMHTSKDDYLINTLRCVSTKEELKSTELHLLRRHESSRSQPLLNSQLSVSIKEPMGKSKRVKRPVKKSTKAPARGVVIRETLEMPLSKKKEKYEEVRRKSMRDFHKTHPSGSGIVTKTGPSAAKLKPFVTNEGTGVIPGVLDVIEEESSESEAESWGNDKDDNYNEQDSSDEDNDQANVRDDEDETNITDKDEGDEDEEMDYTTSQLYDDVDIRLNEPVDTDKGFIQEEDIPHMDAEIVFPMDVHVHHEVPSKQTPTLLTVPVSVITDSSPVYSTVIPQSFPSFTPSPQQSTSTPPPTTEATNPPSTLPNFASVFQFNNRVTALEKEVAKLKKDPLHTQVTALVDDHLDARLRATRDKFVEN